MFGLLKKLTHVTCLLLACASITRAAGVVVTVKYTPVSGGYRYFFTVDNNTTAQPGEYVWAVEALTLRSASDLVSPAGLWSAQSYISDLGPVWCIARGQGPIYANWQEGIPPGESLSGFAITSPDLKQSIYYRVLWFNSTGGSTHTGYAYPTPVPEPSALMALMGGLGALGLPMLRRKRKS